jgi:hypothetical protein
MITASNADPAETGGADGAISLIRAAATIGFTISPCSRGFLLIAVSKGLIRAIMVGDDPEMLVSDLQNQFPNDVIEVSENDFALSKQIQQLERYSGVRLLERSAELSVFGAECPGAAHR